MFVSKPNGFKVFKPQQLIPLAGPNAIPSCTTHLLIRVQHTFPRTHIPQHITSLNLSYPKIWEKHEEPDWMMDNLPIHLQILNAEVENKPLDHLPPSLKKLNLGRYPQAASVDHLPSSLTHLTFYFSIKAKKYGSLDHLPQNLTHLETSWCNVDHLPSLISLKIVRAMEVAPEERRKKKWLKSLDHLPSSLKSLDLKIGRAHV